MAATYRCAPKLPQVWPHPLATVPLCSSTMIEQYRHASYFSKSHNAREEASRSIPKIPYSKQTQVRTRPTEVCLKRTSRQVCERSPFASSELGKIHGKRGV